MTLSAPRNQLSEQLVRRPSSAGSLFICRHNQWVHKASCHWRGVFVCNKQIPCTMASVDRQVCCLTKSATSLPSPRQGSLAMHSCAHKALHVGMCIRSSSVWCFGPRPNKVAVKKTNSRNKSRFCANLRSGTVCLSRSDVMWANTSKND